MVVKNNSEIKLLRESGKHLRAVLSAAAAAVKPGVTTRYIDSLVRKKIEEYGDKPAFLGYQPFGASYPFPAAICVSINDEVVHGIPGRRILKDGDIVGLDLGLNHEGVITDAAVTIPVGRISDRDTKLINITKRSLAAGIRAIRLGGFVNDIGTAIERVVAPHGYGIVKILSGHGVGKKVHEDPYVPNYDTGKRGAKLALGLVIAIEPMINEGTEDVYLSEDGYTFKTADKKKSAHFEHTVLVTKNGAEILT